ncbi:MAG: type I 3-dehydroquinate dehydratase [Planctomycetota bacterium]
MTLLVASVFVHDVGDLEVAASKALVAGADAVELRLDDFEGEAAQIARFLSNQSAKTWIVTCRCAAEGGHFTGDTMERVSRLLAAARGTGAFVDFELADWERSSNIRQKVTFAATPPDGGNPRLILSSHRFDGPPGNLGGLINRVFGPAGTHPRLAHAAIAKVAYRAEHIVDSFAALDAMHEHGRRVAAMAMGDAGLWTRILARKFHAFATYSSMEGVVPTAPGQLSIREMIDDFRWNAIDGETRVFGVLADPVGHSLSPSLINRWFGEHGVNGVFVPLRVARDGAGLSGFLDGCAARPWLDLGGFSVTVPHKASARQWLGERVDPLARRIGAVNTICFRDGEATGFNTDCYAAVSSLVDALGASRAELAGVSIDILGGGGATRAVATGLHELGARLTVFARSAEPIADWCASLGCELRPWSDRVRRKGEVVINCTPMGMWPEVDSSPLPAASLSGCRLVFDLIYRPLQTALLREAEAAGCRAVNGLYMFVRQAAAQFELWTGRRPDAASARSFLEQRLSAAAGGSAARGGKRCIALIGYRGSGKTTVGRELARLLGGSFVDTDDLIVRGEGQTIAQLFAEKGEAAFRAIESAVIVDVLRDPPAVLAVGGGAVTVDANVVGLRKAATVVWLTACPEILARRIQADPGSDASRPPLTGKSSVDEIRTVLTAREAMYHSAAHLQIDASGDDPVAVARQIAGRAPSAARSG